MANEAQDYSQYAPQAGYYAPSNDHSSHIVELTDPEEILNEFQLELSGLQRDAKGKVTAVPGSGPLLNSEGVSAISGMLKSLLNKMSSLSTYSKQEITSLLWSNQNELIDKMMYRNIYGIKNDSDASRICQEFFNYMLMITSGRSNMERLNDKKFFRGSTHEQRTAMETPRQGFSSMFRVFGGKH